MKGFKLSKKDRDLDEKDAETRRQKYIREFNRFLRTGYIYDGMCQVTIDRHSSRPTTNTHCITGGFDFFYKGPPQWIR